MSYALFSTDQTPRIPVAEGPWVSKNGNLPFETKFYAEWPVFLLISDGIVAKAIAGHELSIANVRELIASKRHL